MRLKSDADAKIIKTFGIMNNGFSLSMRTNLISATVLSGNTASGGVVLWEKFGLIINIFPCFMEETVFCVHGSIFLSCVEKMLGSVVFGMCFSWRICQCLECCSSLVINILLLLEESLKYFCCAIYPLEFSTRIYPLHTVCGACWFIWCLLHQLRLRTGCCVIIWG